jgi:hypothetical protein
MFGYAFISPCQCRSYYDLAVRTVVENSSSLMKANGRYHYMRFVQNWVREYGNMNLQIVLRIVDGVIGMIL